MAAECIEKQIGRVRFRIIPEVSSENLIPFIEYSIENGSTVITDGWSGNKSLINNNIYTHEVKKITGGGKQTHELLPHVHLVDSLVKRWINGTHQGNISAKHLAYYLDEFAFRFNRKLSTYRGKLFYRLMQQAVTTLPSTFDDITK